MSDAMEIVELANSGKYTVNIGLLSRNVLYVLIKCSMIIVSGFPNTGVGEVKLNKCRKEAK